MSTPRKQLDISITSDSICPFCFLGLKKIEKAIESLKNEPIDFTLDFQPFQLDPTLPLDHGVNKRKRYEAKFGGSARVAQMEETMRANGRPYGIEFDYGGDLRNTRDNHRLIWKARQIGGEKTQRAVVEKLFSAYFEHRKDPGDHAVLADCAAEAGVMERQAALDWLKTDEGMAEYEAGILRSQQLGISGVPFVIFGTPDADKRFAISGAQDPETFAMAFKKAARL